MFRPLSSGRFCSPYVPQPSRGTLLLLEGKNDVPVPYLGKEIAKLGFGVGLGGGEVFFGEAVVEHLAVGLLVEGLVGLWGPFATLVEGLGFGFVDEVFVQEGDLG